MHTAYNLLNAVQLMYETLNKQIYYLMELVLESKENISEAATPLMSISDCHHVGDTNEHSCPLQQDLNPIMFPRHNTTIPRRQTRGPSAALDP